MKATELKQLSDDELQKKEKGTKSLIGIFVPIILGLLFFIFRDYFRGNELDWSILTITICTVGGMLSLLPQLKAIRKELNSRTH